MALSETPKNASPFGLKVARVLDDTWALYNLRLKRVDFSSNELVEINIDRTLSTYDFDYLTQLVIRCHDACIRLSVASCNMRYLKVMFHPRKRDGSTWERHPTMEQAIERVRSRNYFGPTRTDPEAVGAVREDTDQPIVSIRDTSSSSDSEVL